MVQIDIVEKFLKTGTLYKILNAKLVITLSAYTCRGISNPIIDENERRKKEDSLKPLESVEFDIEEDIVWNPQISLVDIIIYIHSLNFNNLAYCQRRQYMEIIHVKLLSYKIIGDAEGTFTIYSNVFSEFNKRVLANPALYILRIIDPIINKVCFNFYQNESNTSEAYTHL